MTRDLWVMSSAEAPGWPYVAPVGGLNSLIALMGNVQGPRPGGGEEEPLRRVAFPGGGEIVTGRLAAGGPRTWGD